MSSKQTCICFTLALSVYTKCENGCGFVKTNPQSIITTTLQQVDKCLSPQHNTAVGKLIQPSGSQSMGSVPTSLVALRWLCDSPRTGCTRRTKIYVCGANKQ